MEADCGSIRSRSQEVVQREMSVVKKAALKDRASALQAAYVAEVKAAAAAEGKKVSLAVYTLNSTLISHTPGHGTNRKVLHREPERDRLCRQL